MRGRVAYVATIARRPMRICRARLVAIKKKKGLPGCVDAAWYFSQRGLACSAVNTVSVDSGVLLLLSPWQKAREKLSAFFEKCRINNVG